MPDPTTTDIKKPREIVEELWPQIQGGNYIVWIGSGLSGDEYPSWEDSINIICQSCQIPLLNRNDDDKEKLKKIDACRKKNENLYLEEIKKIFGKHPEKIPPAYVYLSKIQFVAYITTNFDPILSIVGLDSNNTIHYYPDLVTRIEGSRKPIYYIHGLVRRFNRNTREIELRPESLVFSETDYQKAYYDDLSTLKHFLYNILLNYPILFLGYRLEDDLKVIFGHIQRILHILKSNNPDRETFKKHILLPTRYDNSNEKNGEPERDYEEEKRENDLYKEIDIEVIRYDPEDKSKHTEIYEILEIISFLTSSRSDIQNSEDLPSAERVLR
ncbi:MAG: SIR2 family protein [Deltaproteobacteria bacterium]|nr:SIR2 family protein [Candidatus Zymogenaceae bacterium]